MRGRRAIVRCVRVCVCVCVCYFVCVCVFVCVCNLLFAISVILCVCLCVCAVLCAWLCAHLCVCYFVCKGEQERRAAVGCMRVSVCVCECVCECVYVCLFVSEVSDCKLQKQQAVGYWRATAKCVCAAACVYVQSHACVSENLVPNNWVTMGWKKVWFHSNLYFGLFVWFLRALQRSVFEQMCPFELCSMNNCPYYGRQSQENANNNSAMSSKITNSHDHTHTCTRKCTYTHTHTRTHTHLCFT